MGGVRVELRAADYESGQGHFYKGLIGQRFPRSFMYSDGGGLSTDSIESEDSVISTPSLTNYHRKSPPSSDVYGKS